MTNDDDPITLKDAAQHFKLGVWTLKAEAGRGNLTTYRIGKRTYTTPNDVREMLANGGKARPVGRLPENKFAWCPTGIYVIGFASYVKIGWSADIKRRVAEIQAWVPEILNIYGLLEGDVSHERRLHRRFKVYRLRGEWFRRDGELAEWIKRECQQ